MEHSGLGRYGDTFNPWGDRIAMARTWCVLKPSGLVLAGVPIGEKDQIAYNAHRVYGPVALPHLLANFRLLWTSHPGLRGPTDQAVFLAQAAA